jgi:hypothetical protein
VAEKNGILARGAHPSGITESKYEVPISLLNLFRLSSGGEDVHVFIWKRS